MVQSSWTISISGKGGRYSLSDYTCDAAPEFYVDDNEDMKHVCIDKDETLRAVLTYLYGTLHENKLPDDLKKFVYVDRFNEGVNIYLLTEQQHNLKNPQNICST